MAAAVAPGLWARRQDATAMRLPLAAVRQKASELRANRSIVTCSLTRYERTKTIEAWQCRVSGYPPSPTPWRKSKGAASAS